MTPQEEKLVDAILASGITLPAPDALLLDLMRLAGDEESGLDELAEAVSRSPATAGAVFRVASSPVFGQIRPKKTVLEAVVLLGKTKVLAIATSTALRSKMGDVPPRVVNAIWEACHTVATETWSLMRRARAARDADQAFLAALMHDVGTAVVLRRHPEFLADFDVDPPAVDAAGLHFDGLTEISHAAVGAHVARNWKLPDDVCDAIALHHSPPPAGTIELTPPQRLAAAIAAGRFRAGMIGDQEWSGWAGVVAGDLGISDHALARDA